MRILDWLFGAKPKPKPGYNKYGERIGISDEEFGEMTKKRSQEIRIDNKKVQSATVLIEYEGDHNEVIEKTAFDTITDLLTEYCDEVGVRVVMFANAEIPYPSPSEPSLSPLLFDEATGSFVGPSMAALVRYQQMKDRYSLEEYPVENLGYCLMKVGDRSVFATVCLPSATTILSKNVRQENDGTNQSPGPEQKETHSMCVPLEYECERCGKKLHGGTGRTVSGGMDVINHMQKKVKRCHSCGKTFCGKCSYEVDEEVGRPKGAVDFTCPFCRTFGIPG